MLNASCRVSRPSERPPPGCDTACIALRSGRSRSVRRSSLLAAAHQRRIGPLRIPFVGVARPDAVGVAHEEARLDQPAVETEVLHQHRAVREIPIAVGADGDVLSVRQSDPALLRRAVGPERRVRRVGNESARGQCRVRLRYAAGGGELRGHARAAAARGGDAVQIAAACSRYRARHRCLLRTRRCSSPIRALRLMVIVGCVSFGMSQMSPDTKSPKM